MLNGVRIKSQELTDAAIEQLVRDAGSGWPDEPITEAIAAASKLRVKKPALGYDARVRAVANYIYCDVCDWLTEEVSPDHGGHLDGYAREAVEAIVDITDVKAVAHAVARHVLDNMKEAYGG